MKPNGGGGETYNQTESGEIVEVLAVVVSRDHGCVFNCGPFYVYGEKLKDIPEPGTFVGLTINKPKTNGDWLMSGSRPVRLLMHKERPGDVKEVMVMHYWSTEKNRIDIGLRLGNDALDIKDRELWETAIFQPFNKRSEYKIYHVWARLNAALDWIPLDRGLTQLLIEACVYQKTGGGKVAVLTFIESAPGPFGETAWHFATGPGQNYLLYDYQFKHEDREQLYNTLTDESSPAGLIVTVVPEITKDTILLTLEKSNLRDIELDKIYPDLKVPFDDRNLQWDRLFSGVNTAIAEKSGSSWCVWLPSPGISGYPENVEVEWKGYRPRQFQHKAEFHVVDWRPWHGKITGSNLYLNMVTPKNRDWADFYNRMSSISKGDHVVLTSDIGRVKAGKLLCLTDERLLVQVNGESLTSKWIADQSAMDIPEPRVARLHSHPFRRNTPLNIDSSSIPHDVLTGEWHTGILRETPQEGTLCKVLWEKNNDVVTRELKIVNLVELNIQPGSKILAQRVQNSWNFSVEVLNLQARALWAFQEWVPGHDAPTYLGKTLYNGKWTNVGELRPGILADLGSVPNGIYHLAPRGDGSYEGGLSPKKTIRINRLDGRPWPVLRGNISVKISRTILTLGSDILPGQCEESSPSKNVTVNGVLLRLQAAGKGYFSLDREFKLKRAPERVEQVGKAVKVDNEKLKTDLTDYLGNPYKLKATYKNSVLKLDDEKLQKVPVEARREEWTEDPDKVKWTNILSFPENEGAFFRDGRYDVDDVTIWLFENRDKIIQASFLRVPPDSPEDFQDRLFAGFGDPKPLHRKLYYVGQEAVDPVNGNPYQETHHRFEWGYGKTLLAPESRLQYMGGPFDTSTFMLFYGDVIKGVTFYPAAPTSIDGELISIDEEEEIAPRSSCIMDITESSIELSPSTDLYTQRDRYKIVHVLHLVYDGEKVVIDYIEGFDDRAMDIKRNSRDFRIPRAFLNDDSQEKLTKRLKNMSTVEASERAEMTVLGLLNVEEFERTRGRAFEFEHVRLSFKHSDLGTPIKSGDILFMRAGEIFDMGNDTALRLHPLSKINALDVGEDMNNLIVLRRQFSARENSLPNYYKAKGKRGLEDSILMVRMNLGSNDRVFLSLIEKTPPRKISALKGAPGLKDGLLFATVVEIHPKKGMQIELRPGVFVRMKPTQIADCPKDLTKGAIIRVEIAPDDRFRVIRAVFADARYIPKKTRYTVALPKANSLKRKGREKHMFSPKAFWNRGHFTVGGLPNVSAVPGTYDVQTNFWSDAKDEEFTKLMETDHPKIVVLGKDKNNRARVGLPPNNAPVGKLKLINENLDVVFSPMEESTAKENETLLKWRFLSFGDESIRAIIDRANRERWVYHDKVTGKWEGDNIKRIPPEGDLKAREVWTGPVFFSHKMNNLHLRYDPGEFLRFGYPVDELIRSLGDGVKHAYPVAGISSSDGLWIELAPGRIVELPSQMVIHSSNKGNIPLTHFNWEGFSPGDVVELALMEDDKLTPAKVSLQSWIPGPRAAMGSSHCYLPLCGTNSEGGSVTFGAGGYTLTLPTSKREFLNEPVVCIDSKNGIFTERDKLPNKDNVVLLGLNKRDQPIVYGFPKLTPLPEQDIRNVWANDPLADEINDWNKNTFRHKDLADLIRAAGGALPFTVESIAKNNNLFVSRRHQHHLSNIPKGAISIGRITGLLPDGKTALLRCGGGVMKMPMDLVVRGLPEKFFYPTAEFLKESESLIWVQGTDDGTIRSGIRDENRSELTLKTINTISHGEGQDKDSGILCHSSETETFHWLPSSKAAFIPLDSEQLHHLFVESQYNTITVKLCGDNHENQFVSIVDAREAAWEFATHGVGSELAVEIVAYVGKKNKNTNIYLVKSARTGVVLECEEYDNNDLFTGPKNVIVEVIQRVSGMQRFLTTTLLGKKRFALDLPSWTTQPLSEPGEKRVIFQKYLKWSRAMDVVFCIEEDSKKRFQDNESPDNYLCDIYEDDKANGNVGSEKLDQYLCYAHRSFEEEEEGNETFLMFQTRVALDWININRYKSEIAPQFAIMAIQLLYQNSKRDRNLLSKTLNNRVDIESVKSEWCESAADMTINLGRRAMRSMHLEVLSREWFFSHGSIIARKRSDGLWIRLNMLIGNIIKDGIKSEDIKAIRYFSRAVRLRNATELYSISDALLAATGQAPLTEKLFQRADITKRITDVYRTFFPFSITESKPIIQPMHIEGLGNILNIIKVNEVDITFLDPLPWIGCQSEHHR